MILEDDVLLLIAFAGLVFIGFTFVTTDDIYYDATVVSKYFDYDTGLYHIDFYSSERPSEQIKVQVWSDTYETISIGDCKLIQETTTFGGFPRYQIYGDCP